ncbi:MAG: dockerin type I domain-containing protein [Phycisphaerae bacterium]
MKEKHKILTLSSAGVLALISGIDAQFASAQIGWTNYLPSNTGIPGTTVRAIHIDQAGLPWFAADANLPLRGRVGGISAFDGNQWHVVARDDYPVLSDPRIVDIIDDASGFRWMASWGGLYRYDLLTGPQTLVVFDPSNSPMPTAIVSDIALAPDGTFWMGFFQDDNPLPTSGGLAQYVPSSGTWKIWGASQLPWIQQLPSLDYVTGVAVTPDPGGGYTVWLSPGFGGGVATLRNGQFNWLGAASSIPASDPTTPTAISGKSPVDSNGNIWLITNHGPARRAPDGTWLVIGHPPGATVGVLTPLISGRLAAGSVTTVFLWDSAGGWTSLGNAFSAIAALGEDAQGAIWAGGTNSGASKYENGQWFPYRHETTGMLDFFIEAIEFDAAGNVYLDGNISPGVGGFNIFDGSTWTGVHDANLGMGPPWGLPTDDVEAFAARANGNVVLVPTGLPSLLEWDGLNYTELLPSGWDVWEAEEDSLGRLWASLGFGGGQSGVFRISGTETIQYTPANSPAPGHAETIRRDPLEAGFVWMADAFALVRTDGDVWEEYPRSLFGISSPTSGTVISSADPVGDGTVWLGMRGAGNGGLIHFDPATGNFTKYDPTNSPLPDDNVHVVEVAPDGSVWAAVYDTVLPLQAGGLVHFDGQDWTVYTWQNSPLRHNQITVLNSRPMPTGYELWVSTISEGVAVLNVATPVPVSGDINGDGVADMGDVPLFAGVLIGIDTDPNHMAAADMNGDGGADGLDVPLFVAALIP